VRTDRAALMARYNNRCGHCLTRPATDTHEVTPRSRDPAGWDREDNMIPLCRPCHVKVQADWRKWAPVLQQDRQRAARLFGWKEEQDDEHRQD
jgi:5-methylcytosine-specific restriction endonuclease McrA